jgi:hypothetical protein
MNATMPAPPPPAAPDDERRRWEQLRRAMLQVVAQFQGPETRYTLSIDVVPKRPAQTT